MHVSWKFAEITHGDSRVYKELYLATQLLQTPPPGDSERIFSQAIHERLREIYSEDPKSIVMVLVTMSVLDSSRLHQGVADMLETPLFPGGKPAKADSDVDIRLD